MAHKRSGSPSGRRGGSAIEFGLTLPVLMVIFSAIVEYGWVFFQQSGITSATRDGARLGSTIPLNATPDPETKAITRARMVLNGYGLTCTNPAECQVTSVVDQDSGGGWWFIEVRVDRDYEPIFNLLPTPERLHGRMTMIIENQVIE